MKLARLLALLSDEFGNSTYSTSMIPYHALHAMPERIAR
jgi:hypothetical protein